MYPYINKFCKPLISYSSIVVLAKEIQVKEERLSNLQIYVKQILYATKCIYLSVKRKWMYAFRFHRSKKKVFNITLVWWLRNIPFLKIETCTCFSIKTCFHLRLIVRYIHINLNNPFKLQTRLIYVFIRIEEWQKHRAHKAIRIFFSVLFQNVDNFNGFKGWKFIKNGNKFEHL